MTLQIVYRALLVHEELFDNFDLLKKWADYLCENGLIPENQLCTDDFAGHLAKNSNLSLKACFGIASFAAICEKIGKREMAKIYMKAARQHAKTWNELCFSDRQVTGISIGKKQRKYI